MLTINQSSPGEVERRTRQLCTFLLDGLYFGVEVDHVQEVISHQPLTGVPLAPSVVQGLINLRGQIVTAIDLRRLLELRERPAGETPLNVVIRSDEGSISLLVDEIGDVTTVEETDFEVLPPTVTGVVRRVAPGAYKLKNRLLLLLDIDKALAAQEPAADELSELNESRTRPSAT